MIDNRFTLIPDPRPNLFHLQFTVVVPKDGSYYSGIELGKEQYPELEFSYTDVHQAKFPDGQYATAFVQQPNDDILFSLPLELDTIMSAVCGFKKAVPSIQYTVNPAELVDLTSDDFHETVENMYSIIGLSLRVRDVSWRFDHISGSTPVYLITPTDYDYI